MEGYDGQFICILLFYGAVWTMLLVLIHSNTHKKLDNSKLGRIFSGIKFVRMANNL